MFLVLNYPAFFILLCCFREITDNKAVSLRKYMYIVIYFRCLSVVVLCYDFFLSKLLSNQASRVKL